MASVSFVPQSLDVTCYAGDGATLRLTLTNPAGAPVELTGTVQAQIRQSTDGAVVDSFAADLSAGPAGVVVLTLTGAQTAALRDGASPFEGVWDAQWTPASGQPTTLVRGRLVCEPDVTRA